MVDQNRLAYTGAKVQWIALMSTVPVYRAEAQFKRLWRSSKCLIESVLETAG